LPPAPPPPHRKTPRAVFICTFAADEPYAEVVEAGRALGNAVDLAITGNPAKADPAVAANLPPNVKFTGFLPEEDYVRLLAEADVLVDLTLMEDCLVCGGYEAAALGKPIVLSDTAALRGYFRRGAVYAKGDRASLAAGISEALSRRDALGREMAEFRGELAADWARKRGTVMDYVKEGAR
jgi:glycosyltransferase involved in cell wall biosynthesis